MMRRPANIRLLIAPALAVAVAVGVAACSSTTSSTTTPSPATTTETFSGTIAQGGSGVNSFTVATTGTVTVSLTAVSPLTTMALGVSIGTWVNSTCGTVMSANKDARSGETALSGTAVAGNYCVTVYDSGNVPTDWSVGYTVQVVHP